jgi:hypothetical protein
MTTRTIDQDQLTLFEDQPRPGEYVIPAGAQPGTCKSCGASIVWAKTPQDRFIPLALGTARDVGGVRYATTHYADCPHGREWKRR